MADPSPLVGLLDRASSVFTLAEQLARAFTDEYDRQGSGSKIIDPKAWDRQRPAFNEFSESLLKLRDVMQSSPHGLEPVTQVLKEAASVARQIRDVMQTSKGQTWQSFLEYRFHLNSVVAKGFEAVQEVNKTQRLDDPFAFLDKPAPINPHGIDSTPTLPEAPAKLIEAAGLGIPVILASVPEKNSEFALRASLLAKKLNDAGHTLAAAHWAIHRAVVAGRLTVGPVETGLPFVFATYNPQGESSIVSSSGMTKHIPIGTPTPFDSFKVVATESLWKWWRELEVTEAQEESPDDPSEEHPPVNRLDAMTALLRVFTNGLIDDRIKKAVPVLSNTLLTTNEKLVRIDGLIPFPPTTSAEHLGKLLGVSKQTVLKSDWWIHNRKGEKRSEIGRRREVHRKRAKGYESPPSDEENDPR